MDTGREAGRGADRGASPTRPWYVLPAIVVAQFLGGSLWFATNAVAAELPGVGADIAHAVAWLTSAVQAGFIAGTLVFATVGLSDRFVADRVFVMSGLCGAVLNAAVVVIPPQFELTVLLRFAVGFTLAGIYPVGMKLAASWYEGGLGRALGYLVGALVLGTAFPHALRTTALPWRPVILATSAAAVVGAILIGGWVPQGPHVTRAAKFSPRLALSIFRTFGFRRAALGYFGHMWELYAFWAFVPLAVGAFVVEGEPAGRVSWWSFAVIAGGALGCAVGGLISQRVGSGWVAIAQLAVSGVACVLSPFVFGAGVPALSLALLVVWGVTVVGDSPQFSALAARASPPELVGTALTLMNAIGFAITVGSIALLGALASEAGPVWLFVVLAPGPLLGGVAMWPLRR